MSKRAVNDSKFHVGKIDNREEDTIAEDNITEDNIIVDKTIFTNSKLLIVLILAIFVLMGEAIVLTLLSGMIDDKYNNGIFLAGIGAKDYREAIGEYERAYKIIDGYFEALDDEEMLELLDRESTGFDGFVATAAVDSKLCELTHDFEIAIDGRIMTGKDIIEARDFLSGVGYERPNPSEYGIFLEK